MSALMSKIIAARGRSPARRLLEARREPGRVQAATLRRILAHNARSAFGEAHGFAGLTGYADYRRAVPVRDYEGMRPFVDRMLGGEPRVLCMDPPFMYGTTSGTTSKRKLIPINRQWARVLSRAMRLWLARSTLAHPSLWRGKVLTFVGPAVEGVSSCGLPVGSVSGLTSERVSGAVKRRYALPSLVGELASHETRYEVAARLMLESDVSLAAAPNPTTLLRLAEVGARRSESIIRGVFEGHLGVTAQNDADVKLLGELEQQCQPNRGRARMLEEARRHSGELLPRDAWPHLALIGCWLGGTAGVFAERLRGPYGDVPLRDLGLRATEATMTVALEDGVGHGAPLLHDNFYEFLPESAARGEHPETVCITELEVGARYFILLTTAAGLYRYDISDVVEVAGMYHDLPLLKFVHKGPDMLNLTGEKVHAQQVATAVMRASDALCASVTKAQVIPDISRSRYDLLLEVPPGTPLGSLAHAIDEELSSLNPEYQSKRASARLGPLNALRMKPGWSQRLQAADVARGSRDAQYKWPFVRHQWDELSRGEVEQDVMDSGPSQCEG